VDYEIRARLDGETEAPKEIRGRERIRWENTTADAVEDAWFHLYLNAFANNRTIHLTESRGRLRGERVDEGWGWSRVTAARVAYGEPERFTDVFASFRYRHPDGANDEDRTVFSLDLPRAVEPGEVLWLEIEWESRLPRVRRRTGYKDDFLLVAQWFPKLGVYEQGRGWNCHSFHANTEFFSDYGTYAVELDLPQRFSGKVGGTGIKDVERLEGGDRVFVRFLAPSPSDRAHGDATGKKPLVHDFAWTADPRYVVKPFHFRSSEWAERFPGEVERARAALGPKANLTLRDVDVDVLIHPEHVDQAERHFRAASAALFFYGLWFGEYPYERVTVVDPAWGAGAAGGMEYPTLFTCGTRLFTTEDMQSPEGVTVHECGHQFWYGLVGNNEFESAWLDEGFNSYTDSEVLWRVYGPSRGTTAFARMPVDGVPVGSTESSGRTDRILSGRLLPMPWILPDLTPVHASGFLDRWRVQPKLSFVQEWTDPRWNDRARYLRSPDADPIDTAGWRYLDRTSYGVNSYQRTAVALRTLASIVGPDDFLRGMRHYSETWRYRHPYPDDFFRTFQEGAAAEVEWYFHEIFRGVGTADWSVEVEQGRRPLPEGFFQREGGDFIEETVAEDAEEDEDPGDAVEDPMRPWQVHVVLRRTGTLSLSMPVRMTFADGSMREDVWLREEQQAVSWKKIEFESDSKLVSVVLDPERGNYLDTDMSNNQWYDRSDRLAPLRWGERVLARYQRYFHWIQGIGG